MNFSTCVSNKRLSPDEIRQLGKELGLPTVTVSSWEQTKKDNKTPLRAISQVNQTKLIELYNFYFSIGQEQTN